MNILLVLNYAEDDADLISDYLISRGIPHTTVRSHLEDPLPRHEDFDVLITFGSPASCMKLDQLPLLARVGTLTREFIQADKPVLGICFGAQLLAHVLGAEVRRNSVTEFGCFEVRLTPAGRVSPLFEGFPEAFPMAQGHSDTFALPAGAMLLGSSDLCQHQAFSLGRWVGLQFHIEASQRKVTEWVRKQVGDSPTEVQFAQGMLADNARTAEERLRLCNRFMDNFLFGPASIT